MENSNFLKLNLGDLGRGFITAVFAALVAWLYGVVNAPDFSIDAFLSVDWAEVLKIAVSAGVAYLAKNLFTDKAGRVFGKIG